MSLRLGAMISGGGRTLLNLLDKIEAGVLDATIETVVASRADLAGVERARARGLDVVVAARREFGSVDALDDFIAETLDAAALDYVCLCGYLRLLRIDEPRRGRVINIHPALLPDFGGKGMYGDNVHAAVLDAGRAFSGCTVHFVDEHYDHGPTILQRVCPVLPGDDVRALADRVFEQECLAFPEALTMLAEGRASLDGDRVVLS